jgi:hypothetical protein
MLKFTDSVLTKGKGGTMEVRALESRGSYVICKYLNPETLKPADKKLKLSLRNEKGEVNEFFIVPLKDPKRSLLITAEKEQKERMVWNSETQQEEDLWK